ncbi:MAG: hypothetical protein ACI9SC_003070 [Gammaproteobacteria bacterium]|jgi:hypothetical protein
MNVIASAFTLDSTRVVLLALVLLGSVIPATADEHTEGLTGKAKLSKLFQSHESLNIRLEGPFKKLGKKRKEDRPYFESALIYKDDGGMDVRIDLKIRVRGNYRAKKEICRFPPLKLNFSKKTLKDTIFDGEDKLKLVTHCQGASKYEQFVLLEYLNYRLQNLLTDYSLRARLATVEYYDTDSKKVIDTKMAFFIEDKEGMATRVGAELLKVKRIEKEQYDQDLLHMATAFEYMLGNTDFSVILGPGEENCCHNIIPLQINGGPTIPVPYDFDGSGIVNPPYLSPPEHLGIRSTRQRLYRGYCQNTAGFKKTFAVFHEQRAAIFDLYNNQAGLEEKTLRGTLSYLENFYESISDDDKIVSEFIDKCRS